MLIDFFYGVTTRGRTRGFSHSPPLLRVAQAKLLGNWWPLSIILCARKRNHDNFWVKSQFGAPCCKLGNSKVAQYSTLMKKEAIGGGRLVRNPVSLQDTVRSL